MARFVIGEPVTTDAPTVTVDAGLALGSHRFRLECVDGAGNVSRPAEAVVRIQEAVVGPDDVVTPVNGPVVVTRPVVRPD